LPDFTAQPREPEHPCHFSTPSAINDLLADDSALGAEPYAIDLPAVFSFFDLLRRLVVGDLDSSLVNLELRWFGYQEFSGFSVCFIRLTYYGMPLMNLSNFCGLPFTALAVTFLCSCPLQAEVTLDAGAKDLKQVEVNRSMIGFRDTLKFYVFEKEKAVLRVQIGNENTQFPVSARLYVFAKDTTAEGLEKWVNNQHSDGLFVDAAEPKATHDIPAAACKAKAHKIGKNEETRNGEFASYVVTIEIKDVPAFGDIKIKDFTDTATVYVKIQVG
jgi:TusA-related sulfurtransferase